MVAQWQLYNYRFRVVLYWCPFVSFIFRNSSESRTRFQNRIFTFWKSNYSFAQRTLFQESSDFSSDLRPRNDQSPLMNFRAYWVTLWELDILLSFMNFRPQWHYISTWRWTVWLIDSSLSCFGLQLRSFSVECLQKISYSRTIISPSILSSSRWGRRLCKSIIFCPSENIQTLHFSLRERLRIRKDLDFYYR